MTVFLKVHTVLVFCNNAIEFLRLVIAVIGILKINSFTT